MLPYQEEYIENCRKYRSITSEPIMRGGDFDSVFRKINENMYTARDLFERNTVLLREKLLPVLDDLYLQDYDTLKELESFADALSQAPRSIDVALASQIHESLLSCYRRLGNKEDVIRGLYKLGMSRYGLFIMLTAIEIPEAEGFSSRMRYCFVEASSYLKYFDEFSEQTKDFILRSLANTYLGTFSDWRDKFRRVRKTMMVFNDEYYQKSAPGLPWERYVYTVHRQMASVLPYNIPEGTLSPEAVTAIMESAHLIFELQYEQAREKGVKIDAHRLMPYYSVEYACGLLDKTSLLTHMEQFMDEGDCSLYDGNNIYRIVSLPAYYVQYLKGTSKNLLKSKWKGGIIKV